MGYDFESLQTEHDEREAVLKAAQTLKNEKKIQVCQDKLTDSQFKLETAEGQEADVPKKLTPQSLAKRGEVFASNFIIEEEIIHPDGHQPTKAEFETQYKQICPYVPFLRFEYKQLVYGGQIVNSEEFGRLSRPDIPNARAVAVYHRG